MGYDDDRLMEALVRAAYRDDWSLDRLLKFADKGLGMTISLLVDGRWIEGILARPEEWADALDTSIDKAFAAAAEQAAHERGPITDLADLISSDSMAGELEATRSKLRDSSFRELVDTRRAAEADLERKLDALGDEDELSDDMKRDVEEITDPNPVITLRQAVIEASLPMNNRHRPIVRVLRSHVSAWHLGRWTEYSGP